MGETSVPTQPATIGRYQVVRRLGAGGMGAVFLARDPDLDRPLAIKLVKDDLSDDPDLRERFTREARSAARLRHPNIITVFDIGEVAGRPFIAMEYIPGESLADIIRRQAAVDVPRVLGWMESLCAGLAHAHKSGIVHRDIKPGNLMVDPDGILKIVDFGIARLGDSQLTREGMLVGTANYMAPEQLLGTGADHRADIFAVGAVFYELLTCRRAFPGTIADGLFTRICHDPPPPLESTRPGLDPDIAAIVDRALAKDPARRYQDLSAMGRDLARIRAGLPDSDQSGDEAPAPTSATTFSPASTPGPSAIPQPLTPPAASRDAPRRTPAPPGLSAPTPSRSVYDVASRPSGGTPPPGSAPGVALTVEETASQRRRRAEIFLDAAEMAIGQGDFSKAASLLDDAARFDPGSSAIAALRAQAESGAAAAKAASERRGEVDRLIAQATAHLGRGEFAAARDLARQVIALEPENWQAHSLSGRIEKAELAARSAQQRQAAGQARARASSRRTLWVVLALAVVGAIAAVAFLAGR